MRNLLCRAGIRRQVLAAAGRVDSRASYEEHARADEIRPVPGEPRSRSKCWQFADAEGHQLYDCSTRSLHPEFAVTRFVVEDTNYLDWYYGLRRLFREGARPKVVILVINARQLMSPNVHGRRLR